MHQGGAWHFIRFESSIDLTLVGSSHIYSLLSSNILVFSIWKEFQGNTRNLGSFGEETYKTIDLHQHLSRISTQKLETVSQMTRDAVTTHTKTASQDLKTANTIELPIGNNVVPLRSDTIRLVQNGCSFHGLRSEDSNQLLKDFLKLVDSLDLDDENWERKCLRLFQFSLCDQASNWLERLPAGSVTTWEDLTTRFLAQFFQSAKDCKNFTMISRCSNNIMTKSISKARTRINSTYYKKSLIMAAIERLAQYEDEGWKDALIPDEVSLNYKNPDIEQLLGALKERIKENKIKPRKIEKITKYPDTKVLENNAKYDFLENLEKKAFPTPANLLCAMSKRARSTRRQASCFDQYQPPQFSVINHPPQETSKEILQAQEDLMEAIHAFLKEYDHIPPNEKCMALLLAEERFLKIKQAMEEERNQPEKPKAITPNEPIEEHDNSLSMGDEHLDTIPATESDEVIKSSVEILVPIPSEFEGISDDTCDEPVCDDSSTFDALNDNSEILSNSNNDDTSSDDDDFEDVEYYVILREKLLNVHRLITNIESLNNNPTPDFVFKSPSSFPIPVVDSDSFFEESDTSLSHLDNSLPEFETSSDHTEETRSGRDYPDFEDSRAHGFVHLFELHILSFI
ncbi:putative reverse transcriptase domain-containing protein [Tanacetum coccineum]